MEVKKIREGKGLTQKELADLCGVTTRTVQNWENGGTIPDMVQKYLNQLQCQSETISPTNDSPNANFSSETEKLLHLLERSQKQIDAHLELARKKDEQMDRLIGIIEKSTNK